MKIKERRGKERKQGRGDKVVEEQKKRNERRRKEEMKIKDRSEMGVGRRKGEKIKGK